MITLENDKFQLTIDPTDCYREYERFVIYGCVDCPEGVFRLVGVDSNDGDGVYYELTTDDDEVVDVQLPRLLSARLDTFARAAFATS